MVDTSDSAVLLLVVKLRLRCGLKIVNIMLFTKHRQKYAWFISMCKFMFMYPVRPLLTCRDILLGRDHVAKASTKPLRLMTLISPRMN